MLRRRSPQWLMHFLFFPESLKDDPEESRDLIPTRLQEWDFDAREK